MGYGAEEYYRPRFRGTDDLLGQMGYGTQQTVDTINRTGENLARSYGEMPRALGEAVSGFSKAYRGAEERVRRHDFEDEAAEQGRDRHTWAGQEAQRAGESHGWAGETHKLNQSIGKLNLGALEAEEALMSKLDPAGISAREKLFNDRMKMSGLGVQGAEEGILTHRAQRGSMGIQNQINQMTLQQMRDQQAIQGLGLALGKQPQQAPQPQIGTGQGMLAPAPATNPMLDKQRELLKGQGYSDHQIEMLQAQAGAANQRAAEERSFIQRTVDPGGAAIQNQITDLTTRMPALRNLVSAASGYKQVGALDRAEVQQQSVEEGLRNASLNPQVGDTAARKFAGGLEIGLPEFMGGGGLVKTQREQAVQETMNVLNSYETQIRGLKAYAETRGDANLLQQAKQMEADIAIQKQLLSGGGAPDNHNKFQPGGGAPAPQGGGERPGMQQAGFFNSRR